MKKSAIDIYNKLPDELKINGLETITERNEKGFESLSKGLGMVPKVEVEDEVEKEREKESGISHTLVFEKKAYEKAFYATISDMMNFWNFTELRNQDKLRDIQRFLTYMYNKKEGDERRIKYFIDQWKGFKEEMKETEPRYIPKLNSFIGHPYEGYENGKWNDKVYKQKTGFKIIPAAQHANK